MIFHQIKAGGDRNFAYLVADKPGGVAALVDPPPDASRYEALVADDRLRVSYVVITHGHGDHTWGVAEARRRYGCKVVAHRSMLLAVDVPVDDGDTVALGNVEMKFIYTPGHSDDHVCVLCGSKLISGDCLFVGKVGGTDLGEGARKEYHSLHEKLMKLDPAVEVWPGHDYGVAPSSTIGHEKATNPFILRESFEAFLDLKANWIDYKKQHGIK
ncbi:MAG: MBL fold metallo-hydrolase [Candidatus Krumholzibacteria bacterium]|nr:MBL fold metallo-hydrolase [Candidatus Krumholzibacteria bacterium]